MLSTGVDCPSCKQGLGEGTFSPSGQVRSIAWTSRWLTHGEAAWYGGRLGRWRCGLKS